MDMPKKDLSKLSRMQMLELLLTALQENEQLRGQVADLQSRLGSAAAILDRATAVIDPAFAQGYQGHQGSQDFQELQGSQEQAALPVQEYQEQVVPSVQEVQETLGEAQAMAPAQDSMAASQSFEEA